MSLILRDTSFSFSFFLRDTFLNLYWFHDNIMGSAFVSGWIYLVYLKHIWFLRQQRNIHSQDVQYADIDHMEEQKDFTIDQVNFKGLKEYFDELRSQGMRTIIILVSVCWRIPSKHFSYRFTLYGFVQDDKIFAFSVTLKMKSDW